MQDKENRELAGGLLATSPKQGLQSQTTWAHSSHLSSSITMHKPPTLPSLGLLTGERIKGMNETPCNTVHDKRLLLLPGD